MNRDEGLGFGRVVNCLSMTSMLYEPKTDTFSPLLLSTLSLFSFAGPISSILVNRYGSRPVVIAGGVMCGVAMVTASFGNTITHLYICVGVIGGMVPTHSIHLIDMACFVIDVYIMCGPTETEITCF